MRRVRRRWNQAFLKNEVIAAVLRVADERSNTHGSRLQVGIERGLQTLLHIEHAGEDETGRQYKLGQNDGQDQMSLDRLGQPLH